MRPHLLVLDDEEGMCRLLSAFFERKGYDVCVFDLNLAGESGLELLSYFKSNFPDLPIIIYTGVEDDDSVEVAMFRGANGFLRKGEPLENLFEAVKSYVANGE
jgi:two-component system, NarL family, response regulator, fimbrial Z protein, FimZ